MAASDELPWKTIEDVHGVAAAFLDAVLRGEAGVWGGHDWVWRAETPKAL
jgi:hypothetical protein